MTESAPSAYTQLLSLGLVWVSVHCAGMCGPIVSGLDVAGAGRGQSAGRGMLSILTYQGGRAMTYALLGALSGLVGAGLAAALEPAGAVLALVFGVALLTRAWWRRRRRPTTLELRVAGGTAAPRRRFDLLTLVRPLDSLSGPLRTFALGAVMGLLPCMITFWALGLAATTGSPIEGALVMVLLVLMTTPVLLGVTLIPRVFGRWRYLPRALMTVSGVWLAMVGLAGLDIVPHVHLPVGNGYTLMLW